MISKGEAETGNRLAVLSAKVTKITNLQSISLPIDCVSCSHGN